MSSGYAAVDKGAVQRAIGTKEKAKAGIERLAPSSRRRLILISASSRSVALKFLGLTEKELREEWDVKEDEGEEGPER